MHTVEKVTIEVATFTDGQSVNRQHPSLGTRASELGYRNIIQPDAFVHVFATGSTIDEIRARLRGEQPSGDGTSTGTNTTTKFPAFYIASIKNRK
jgi:hypothetical protein